MHAYYVMCRCGHCKTLAPEMKVLAAAYLNDPSLSNRVTLAKVNADKWHEIGATYGVEGFPTIMWLPRGGKEVDARPYVELPDGFFLFYFLMCLFSIF